MLTFAWSAAALAQPGDHLTRGGVVVVPQLGIEAEYQTNAYESEVDAVPAASLAVHPALGVTAKNDDHALTFAGDWQLRRFVFDGAPTVRPGTLDRYDDFGLTAGLDSFLQSPVGVRFAEDLHRWNFPADAALTAVPYDSQLRNTLSGGLRLGSTTSLAVVPGARWTYDAYQLPGVDRSVLDSSNSVGPTLDATWTFLPSTSILIGAEWTRVTWANPAIPASDDLGIAQGLVVPDSTLAKVRGGLDGRVTRSVMVRLVGGYGEDLVDRPTVPAPHRASDDLSGVDGVLADAQLAWLITPTHEGRPGSALTGGYLRDFRPSFFTSWLQLDQTYVDLHLRYGAARPGLRAEVRTERYHGSLTRTDLVGHLGADVEIAPNPWLTVTAASFYEQRHTLGRAVPVSAPVDFDDFGLQSGVTFRY